MARFLSDDLTDRDWKKMESARVKKKKPLPGVLKLLLLISLMAAFSVAAFMFLGQQAKNGSQTDKTDTGSGAEEAVEGQNSAAPSDEEMKARGTVVILKVDKKNSRLRVRDPETDEEYELNMAGNTIYEDNAGNPMVADQLRAGDIVDILVSVHSSDLSYVKENKDSDIFEFRDITDYDISLNKGVFSYDGSNYKILPGTLVIAGDEISSFKEIKEGDVLTIAGKGRNLYTVQETGGNGYVRVTGAESFKGGWIELGNVIRPIDDEMLITVPEGSYDLVVTYMHYGGTKSVNVMRGRETRVDVSDLKGDLLKTGMITFAFDPVNASPAVYIDGKMIIKENPLELDYGVHTLEVKADGYVDIHKYLKVGEPMANLTIVLEKEKEKDTPSANSSEKNSGKKSDGDKDSGDKKGNGKKSDPIPSETLPEVFKTDKTDSNTTGSSSEKSGTENNAENGGNTGNDNINETVTTDVSQLYIDGPEGAEVYYDGAYKGIAPCHFTKNGGTHVITLMKNGCETRSYTISLSSGRENESYTFNELEEELEEEEHDA